MKRRTFLKATPVAVLPALLSGMTIKAFGASPLISALTANDSDTDHVLVLIQMTGGNDGLNTVIPLEYFSNYVNARQNIFIREKIAQIV